MTSEDGGTYICHGPAQHGIGSDRGVEQYRDGRCLWRTAPFSLSCRKTEITGLQADPTTLRLLQQYGAVSASGLPDTVEAKQQPVDAASTTAENAAVDVPVAQMALAPPTARNVATGAQPISSDAGLPAAGIKISETT